MRSFFILFVTLFLVANVSAKGKKTPPLHIAFYTESADVQSRKFAVEVDTPKGKRFINKTPFLITTDIEAYRPFTSPHNPRLLGASFQLDTDGARRLNRISQQFRGKWIVCMMNGRVIDMLHVDKPVDGRIITVWRGIDPSADKACNLLIPRIGEDKKDWKKRIKLEKKAAKKR